MADAKKKSPTLGQLQSPWDFFSINRETVESIVVAVILALMFRAFVAEAFVIPTGSMAPTLMGRHVDTWCEQCGCHFQVGGSSERDENDRNTGFKVADGRCPNCGYRQSFDKSFLSNENSFSGDRIIVSKFAYELSEPKRWDVIVFKNPNRTQQNFIKRLVGLPNETLLLSGGNVYTKPTGSDDSQYKIARKEADSKLLAMLQLVHDSDHAPEVLIKAGWPLWWQPHGSAEAWKADELGKTFTLSATEGESLIRYHHFDPRDVSPDSSTASTWQEALQGGSVYVDPDWRGRLISDFYAYNCERIFHMDDPEHLPEFAQKGSDSYGQHWVDDLAVECEIELGPATGEVVLDMVRGGMHHTCRIDAKSGQATLQIVDGVGSIIPLGEGATKSDSVRAATSLRSGTHRVRLSNVDHELRLWIDGSRVPFEGPTVYESAPMITPDVQSEDGDIAPIGIGGKNQALTVRHLRVLRDKYYIATDYGDYNSAHQQARISEILADPRSHSAALHDLLASRRSKPYILEEAQYMPLGDNSPASSDARFWRNSYVDQRLLIGKAIFIYWPHSWNMPPFWPNFRRMQPIR